jgi:serine/threonine protein kinase
MSEKDNYQFEIFGRYLILDHVVDGGMAKIYRARFLGEKADKIVAIKMVQPAFSKDKNFQEMFDNELKLAFALHHPNICQTYDYGKYKGIWYTAMEYIDGKNLKQFLDRLKKRNESFPLHLVTYIISQVCQGLYYAHTFTEKLSGNHYNIIHRDISPHNIMVTYDGAIKVIDFGIAKTELANESTQAGTIKGKLSYLAPEYIEGAELDQRYDMFAVGITLWEMLCGKKLFTGTNDLNVINQIRECNIPAPSSINPTVPKELDHIVLKVLNRDRDLRYRDMNAFSRALLRFLYTHYPDFNPLDLADFSRDIFSDEIKKDREKLLGFGKMDIQQYIADSKKGNVTEVSAVTTSGVDPATVEKMIGEKPLELELDIADLKEVPPAGIPGKLKDQGIRSQKLPPLPTGKLQTSINLRPSPVAVPQIKSKHDSTGISRIRKKPATKESGSSSSGRFVASFALICGLALFYAYKNDFDLKKILGESERTGSERSVSSIAESSLDKESETGVIYLENYELTMGITINDKEEIYSPLGIKVPLNQELKIVVSRNIGDQFERRVTLTKDNRTQKVEIPTLSSSGNGTLTITKKYKAGSVLYFSINGRSFKEQFPIRNYRIPAGTHLAVIVGPDKKVIERLRIEIRENKTHTLD